MKKKIIFIDRDGTIISEPKDFQVDHINKLNFEPNVINSLFILKEFGYILIMITNQDNLGTKKFPQSNFDFPHNLMLKILASQGVFFDKILICPHAEKDNCLCRKPKTKLVSFWLEKNLLDQNNSYVIGDRDTDIELAKNMKIKGLKYHSKKLNWKKIVKSLTQNNRCATIKRNTNETSIEITVFLDKQNDNYINTGINFFNHMIYQICIHSGISMHIKIEKNDLYIDDHHTVEDTAIVIGKAILKALKDKIGIGRFGFVLPMDDCISFCAIDASNRPYIKYKSHFRYQHVGDLSTEMIEHFFRSISYSMSINLYLRSYGNNDHHKAESLFKAFGKSLKQVIKIEGNILPSSKGLL